MSFAIYVSREFKAALLGALSGAMITITILLFGIIIYGGYLWLVFVPFFYLVLSVFMFKIATKQAVKEA